MLTFKQIQSDFTHLFQDIQSLFRPATDQQPTMVLSEIGQDFHKIGVDIVGIFHHPDMTPMA